MKLNVTTKVKTRIIDIATRRVISESPWQKNLILDNGLNALAGSTNATYLANLTAACRIGSSNQSNSTTNGAITFTQVAFTIQASGAFFTAPMVGQLFKYGSGTGGAEYYITAVNVGLNQATVDTSATVAVPTAGTVWAVNQTTLVTPLLNSINYESTAGSCQTTFSANQLTHKRTYNFAPQPGTINVNEIGYFSGTAGTTVFGRLVLGSTDVVPNTSFYQVVLSVTVTFSPGAPAAVANVGTNIDTSGNAMLECINQSSVTAQVQASGAATGAGALDFGSISTPRLILITATYAQNGAVGNLVAVTRLEVTSAAWVYGGARGKMTLSYNTTISTAAQTLFGVGISAGSAASSCFDVKLTTTFALPTGTFLPQTVFALTYSRTLTN